MNIYTALQMGEYHLNHCEDYLFTGDIGQDKLLCAVMDGCTMGVDSYFMATLTGKLLRKVALEKSYKERYQTENHQNLDDYLKSILRSLFKELVIAKNQLMLDDKELLSTIIILLMDKRENKGIMLAVGDGLVSINGVTTTFDHDNKPDYIGFHLDEDFDTWYAAQTQKMAFSSLQDISIATDGIFMFAPIKDNAPPAPLQPIDYLLTDKENQESADMLELKLKRLEHVYGLKPTDDFAMIRLIA